MFGGLKLVNRELVTGRGNDALLGSEGKYYVVCGPTALSRVGLTSYYSDEIHAWTLCPYITGIHTNFVTYFFSPFAECYADTKPSIACEYILEPTRERALIEYILLREYFDEGILIEGLKNYMWLNNDDVSKLYELAPKYHLKKETLDYWLQEAREDLVDP